MTEYVRLNAITVVYQGRLQSLWHLCLNLGVAHKYNAVRMRLRKGWPVNRALSHPFRRQRERKWKVDPDVKAKRDAEKLCWYFENKERARKTNRYAARRYRARHKIGRSL